jgi:hypothetical protein
MDIYDPVFSPSSSLLSEQIALQIFDILPENGPIMVIMDNQSNYWPSNGEEFSKLNIDIPFLRELCARIDDGVEPIITQINNISVTIAQLATEQSNYGYVIIALPQYSAESTLINIDLIETLLNQTAMITALIEENNRLRELQMKLNSKYGRSAALSN